MLGGSSKGILDFTTETNLDFNDGKDEFHSEKAKKKRGGGFQTLDLHPKLFKGVMKMGYKVPTPIQRQSIPELLAGHDVVAMARTGSGKTAAFVIPLLQKLLKRNAETGCRAVVISPTRELALQTDNVVRQLGKYMDLLSVCIVGGVNLDTQYDALSQNPDIIIATPGRLAHHIVEARLRLNSVIFACFDEADRLFEMGFAPQINSIIKNFSSHRQTCLFSATMPKLLAEFTRAGLNNPELIRLDTDAKLSENLKFSMFNVRTDEKPGALMYLLRDLIQTGEQTIVFAATKHHVELLYQLCEKAGIPASLIYGELDPAARKINIAKFKKKLVNVLVVTDVAARGIDVPLLDNVIHYDFPAKPKLFVHRSGRVARAGRTGTAYCLVSPDEVPYMVDLMLFLGHKLQNRVPEGSKYDSNCVYYGSIPRDFLDMHIVFVAQLIKQYQLEKQELTVHRAYKMYYKTRSGASASSARRAKEVLKTIPIHPFFIHEKGYKPPSQEFTTLMSSISSFDTGRTIFETLESKSNKATEMMKMKRQMHDHIIRQQKQREERASYSEITGEMKTDHSLPEEMMNNQQEDEDVTIKEEDHKNKDQFFLSGAPNADPEEKAYSLIDFSRKEGSGSGHMRIEDLVLELDGDSNEMIQKQNLVQKWDKKQRKYKLVNVNEKDNWLRPKKNESGAIIDNKKRRKVNRFAEWQNKSKVGLIQNIGAGSSLNDGFGREGDQGGYAGRGRSGKGGLKRKTPKTELKSRDQIEQQRKIQSKNRMQHARHNNNKRGGRGGGGRR